MAEKASHTSIKSVSASSQPSHEQQREGLADNVSEKIQEAREDGLTAAVDAPPESLEYLSGLKLFLVVFSLTLAVFLMLLDSSVVATVSQASGTETRRRKLIGILCDRQPQRLLENFIRWMISAGTAQRICWPSESGPVSGI